MSEGLTKRVGRIISGSINAIVDAVEGTAPEIVMEQAIREIDGAVDEVRSELGKVIASKHLANKRLSEKNTRHEDLADKIEVAVAEGRDDLVEAAISNQLDIEDQMPVLEHTIAECGDREKELEGYITALQAKKHEMKDELKAYRETTRSSSIVTASGTGGNRQSKVNKVVDNATSTFDRILEKQTGLGGIKTADAQDAAKMAELEQLRRKNRIKERVAAIKSGTED